MTAVQDYVRVSSIELRHEQAEEGVATKGAAKVANLPILLPGEKVMNVENSEWVKGVIESSVNNIIFYMPVQYVVDRLPEGAVETLVNGTHDLKVYADGIKVKFKNKAEKSNGELAVDIAKQLSIDGISMTMRFCKWALGTIYTIAIYLYALFWAHRPDIMLLSFIQRQLIWLLPYCTQAVEHAEQRLSCDLSGTKKFIRYAEERIISLKDDANADDQVTTEPQQEGKTGN